MLTTTYLHSGWEFIQTKRENTSVSTSKIEWLPATVPGHVHLDLVENGIIADPFVQMNELGCQWVDETDWTYRTQFEWTPQPDLPNRILKFEGLDTICIVFLNGQELAKHDNMFVPLEVDVTDKLVEGTNQIRIDFQSAISIGEARRAEYFTKEGLKPDQGFFPERSFVRKAQYMYGWDWGPRLVSCGVWRPVSLIQFAARLLDVHVQIDRPEPDVVVLNIASEIEGEGTVIHCLEGAGCRIGDGAFVLSEPDTWSPDDPVRYRLTSGIYPLNEDLEPFQIDPDILDDEATPIVEAVTHALLFADGHHAITQFIGFSEIKLVQEPDEFGESFEFTVNGERIWARGANWIPDHSFPSIVTRERYREQLERCLDMGFNMLRVWGGGLYETDDFYDLCDEMGILVWQDFPFGCAYYPDDEAAQKVIEAEATVNIKRLRNRPSLALWCGNNENHEMYHNAWGGMENRPPRYYGLPIYESTLPELVAKLDPKRSYIASSPIGSPPAEKVLDEKRRGPNADCYGDQHNWDVWHGRGDWRYYSDSKGRFSSEYGFASSCTLECWESAGVESTEDYHGPVARWHDKTGKGHETFVGYTKLHYPEPLSLEDWIYYSQLNQRDALRHGVEHYRRSEFCRGSLIWQVNDCWPVQSWAILDSLGNYKALAYELRRLYADIMFSIERHNEKITLWVANDGFEAWADSFSLQAYHTVTGELLREWDVEAECDSDHREAILHADITGLNVNETLLIASTLDAEQPVWRLLGEPKETKLPAPGRLTVSTVGDGHIRIHTDTPLIDLMLTDEGSVKNLHDNFLTIPQPGTFDVRVHTTPTKLAARSLAGNHPITITRSPL